MRAVTPKYDAIMTQLMDDPKKLLMSVILVSIDALNEHEMLEPPPQQEFVVLQHQRALFRDPFREPTMRSGIKSLSDA